MDDFTKISKKTPKTLRPEDKVEYQLITSLKKTPMVLDKVKKAHQGIVNIYMIDEELLNIIMALFKEEPLFSDKKIGEVDF